MPLTVGNCFTAFLALMVGMAVALLLFCVEFTTARAGIRHGCQMAKARFLDRMCLALQASGLWLRYATLQNLIHSFPWIAPPHPPLWRNPRKGRDQILPSGNLGFRPSLLDCYGNSKVVPLERAIEKYKKRFLKDFGLGPGMRRRKTHRKWKSAEDLHLNDRYYSNFY